MDGYHPLDMTRIAGLSFEDAKRVLANLTFGTFTPDELAQLRDYFAGQVDTAIRLAQKSALQEQQS